MRTFILVCVVAVVVAVGLGYAVGLVAVSMDHSEDIYTMTLTVDTGILRHNNVVSGVQGAEARPLLPQQALLDMKGRIAAVRPEKNEFALADGVQYWNFRLANDGLVLIDGRASKLTDLRTGDEASVRFERLEQIMIASAVLCTRN